MKDKIRSIFTKVLYILFALFISIALWLFVEITENEFITTEIVVNEADFVMKNLELLNSRGLLVSNISPEEMILTFEGPLGEISKLTSSNITLELDFENMRSTGTYPLDYTVVLPDSVNSSVINVTRSTHSQVLVAIDRLSRREFPIEVNYTGGTASEDFIAEPAETEPHSITINGPEELISKIAHIYVPIKAENLSATYTDELSFIMVDDQGREIDSSLLETRMLTASTDLIRVTIPIKQLKTLPLHVELLHGVTTTSENTTWQCDPQMITVSGEPEAIRELGNSITIGTIDMKSFSANTTREFTIILPNHLNNISNINIATVMVQVLNLHDDFRTITAFQAINVPVGYTAAFQTQTMDVRIRGTEAALETVKPENIWLVADLTDFEPGARYVTARAQLYNIDADVDIIGEYRLVVRLTEDTGINGRTT